MRPQQVTRHWESLQNYLPSASPGTPYWDPRPVIVIPVSDNSVGEKGVMGGGSDGATLGDAAAAATTGDAAGDAPALSPLSAPALQVIILVS